MPKKKPTEQVVPTASDLSPLLSIDEIRERLNIIFPESFPDRGLLVGLMAAKVIYVFLYGGFVEGTGRYLRPSFIYLFTEEQAQKTTDEDRIYWVVNASKAGFRPSGTRWYADTSREPIRDDLMRNVLLPLGIMLKRPGAATTASTPINYMSKEFSYLFDISLHGGNLLSAIEHWRTKHLSQATLQRMALTAQGIHAKTGDILIDMPDGTRIRISGGPSSNISKSLIEEFAPIHLNKPAVLWLSASDKKSYPQFAELAKSVGLAFNPSKELPDLIFADMVEPVSFVFCEVVATDGAVTNLRKEAILELVKASKIPEQSVKFLSAFEDRSSGTFKKNFSKLAVDTLVWFRTEPNLLVILDTASKKDLDLK